MQPLKNEKSMKKYYPSTHNIFLFLILGMFSQFLPPPGPKIDPILKKIVSTSDSDIFIDWLTAVTAYTINI